MLLKTTRTPVEFRFSRRFRGSPQSEYSFRSVVSGTTRAHARKGVPVKLRPRVLVVILTALLLLALPASIGARTTDDPVLIAQVGTSGAPDAFRITLTDSS